MILDITNASTISKLNKSDNTTDNKINVVSAKNTSQPFLALPSSSPKVYREAGMDTIDTTMKQ